MVVPYNTLGLQWAIPPYSFCDVHGHATHDLIDLTLSSGKSMHTHIHGHYSHHCLELLKFNSKLEKSQYFSHTYSPFPLEEVPPLSTTTNVSPSICYISEFFNLLSSTPSLCSSSFGISLSSSPLRVLPYSIMVGISSQVPSSLVGVMSLTLSSHTIAVVIGSNPIVGPSFTTPNPSIYTTPTFCTNEEIMEALNYPKHPWDDMHHHSYFSLRMHSPLLFLLTNSCWSPRILYPWIQWTGSKT